MTLTAVNVLYLILQKLIAVTKSIKHHRIKQNYSVKSSNVIMLGPILILLITSLDGEKAEREKKMQKVQKCPKVVIAVLPGV